MIDFGQITKGLLNAYLMKYQIDQQQRAQQQEYDDWVRRALFMQQLQAPERQAQASRERLGLLQQRAQLEPGNQPLLAALSGAYVREGQPGLPTRQVPVMGTIPGPRPEEGGLSRLLSGRGTAQIQTGTEQQFVLPRQVEGLTPYQQEQVRLREIEMGMTEAYRREQLALSRGNATEAKRWHDIQANLSRERERRIAKTQEPTETVDGRKMTLAQIEDEMRIVGSDVGRFANRGRGPRAPENLQEKEYQKASARLKKLTQARTRLLRRVGQQPARPAVGQAPAAPAMMADPLGIR